MLSHETNDPGADDLFITRFEQGALESFGHEDHVRVAYVYATRGGCQAAVAGARRIRGVAAAAGHPEKFHETMTVAWARVIAHLVQRSGPMTFAEFLAGHPQLVDRRLLSAHYSHDVLFSDQARAVFVEPDLMALP